MYFICLCWQGLSNSSLYCALHKVYRAFLVQSRFSINVLWRNHWMNVNHYHKDKIKEKEIIKECLFQRCQQTLLFATIQLCTNVFLKLQPLFPVQLTSVVLKMAWRNFDARNRCASHTEWRQILRIGGSKGKKVAQKLVICNIKNRNPKYTYLLLLRMARAESILLPQDLYYRAAGSTFTQKEETSLLVNKSKMDLPSIVHEPFEILQI